jgi:hypothetical protein
LRVLLLFDSCTILLREEVLHELEQGPIPVCPSFNQSDDRDFGAITLLMEDGVGGLQIWDTRSNSWADVKPVPGTLPSTTAAPPPPPPPHVCNSGGSSLMI